MQEILKIFGSDQLSTLYIKIINEYNKKMWQVDDNKLIDTFLVSPKGATIKDGPRAAWDIASISLCKKWL